MKNALVLAAAAAAVALPSLSHAALRAPQKLLAVLDATQNFGTTQRAVSYYDVTNLTSANVLNQQPLFSIWSGYEIPSQTNYEDPDTITINPRTGMTYMGAFDSLSAGSAVGDVDVVGDSMGDYDLYRLNLNTALADYYGNGRARDTMYAPTAFSGAVNPQHPSRIGTTVNLAGVSTKIGEVARAQDGPFYDVDLDFVRPDRFVFLDNQTGADVAADDTPENDHMIRVITRVGTTQGLATSGTVTVGSSPSLQRGGYNSTSNAESWESDVAALVNLDFDSGTGLPVGRSEPVDIQYVKRNGVEGIWILEADGGGDDISFMELDFASKTGSYSTIDSLGTTRSLDQDPETSTTTNDGSGDWLKVDNQGQLLIGESGNFDTPQHEPAVQRLNAATYSSGNIATAVGNAWDVFGQLAPGVDDDALVTDGRFVTYDRGTGYVYYFDIDSGSLPGVVADLYVYDPATSSVVYQELNAANHFTERHAIELIFRGDLTEDGVITAADIDVMQAARLGADALEKEWNDLTGDFTTTQSDVDELVLNILGTLYGDANLDGVVNFQDLTVLASSYNQNNKGWALGDFNGDMLVNFQDLTVLSGNYNQFGSGHVGTSSLSSLSWDEALAQVGLSNVPEPTSLAAIAAGAGLLLHRRRRASSFTR